MKKGYIKTIEAFIAIVLVLIVIYTIVPKHVEEVKIPPIVKSSQDFITNEILNNDTLRGCILLNPRCENSPDIINLINKNLPVGYDCVFRICNNPSCATSYLPLDKSVYMDDIFIAPDLENSEPKILRLWFWEKEAKMPEPSCSDNVRNGNEAGVDCGGSCRPCVG